MLPIFSIITITYNAEATVESTIKSVLKQTYPNIEYIIVDGASNDGTINIIERYKSRINKFISEKDTGIYDAMNKGLNMATGDYVWFVNAGDTIYESNTLSNIAEQISKQPMLPGIIYGETAIIDDTGSFIYMRRLKAPEKLGWRSFKNGMLVSHQSFIVKREIAPLYNQKYRFSADFDWCIRCMKKTDSIYNSHLVLSNYLNEGATTRNMKASLKERFKIMCEYYGRIPTYLRHIKFAIRFALSKFTGKV